MTAERDPSVERASLIASLVRCKGQDRSVRTPKLRCLRETNRNSRRNRLQTQQSKTFLQNHDLCVHRD
jgi:hypothetical protein